MRQHEFENLVAGDLCTIIRGNDAGKIVEVVHIELCPDGSNAIVIRPAGDSLFESINGTVHSRHLKITTSRELHIYGYKD